MGPGGSGGESGIDCEALGCEYEGLAACGDTFMTWVCLGPFDRDAFMAGGCIDAGSQVPRMCCPSDFAVECQ